MDPEHIPMPRSNPGDGHPLRVATGIHPFAGPLGEGLADDPGLSFETHDIDALAARFEQGLHDVVLLPPACVLCRPRVRLIPGVGASTHGPAETDTLWTRGPLERAHRLAAAPGCRAAALLARTVLAERGVSTELFPWGPARSWDGLDGVVLDAASAVPAASPFGRRHDLCLLWTELTGLPYVHLMWACAPGAAIARARSLAVQALQRGRESRAEPSPDAPGDDAPRFALGGLEMDGLRRLVELAVRHGFLPQDTRLVLC